MKNSNEFFIIRILNFMKKNSATDDEYKEERIRDKTKESREKYKESLKVHGKIVYEDRSSEKQTKCKENSQIHSTHSERLFGDKKYEDFSNIPQIRNSEIWNCPAGFSEEQKKLVKHIIHMESVKMGVPTPHVLIFNFPDEEKSLGYYDHSVQMLAINSCLHGKIRHQNLYQIIFTAIHELRHSYQNQMMDNPDKFPFIKQLIKDYFDYEREIYPSEERIKTEEGIKKYMNNALEVDANAYANDRMAFYLNKSISEISALEHCLEESVRSQILMTISSEAESGYNSLMAVGKDFDKFKDNEKKRNGYKQLSFSDKKPAKNKMVNNNSKNHSVKGEHGTMAEVMSGAIDLSEEAQKEAAKRYMEVIQNIQHNCESMIRNFEERIKEHPYKQLQHVANTFIDLHNTDVPAAIKNAIREWTSSDESFAKLLQEVDEDCSSESIRAAEKLQEDLEEQVSSYFTSISKIKIDKSIKVNEEMIRADQVFVDGWLKELSALKGQCKTLFENLSAYNAIYANMISMVATTFTNVESVYDGAQTDVSKVAENYKDKRKANVDRSIHTGNVKVAQIKDTKDIFTAKRQKMM